MAGCQREGHQGFLRDQGIGAGLEIWKLQFSAKYFWNFGGIYQSDIANTANTIKGLKDSNNFNGVAFSLAILF